MKKETLEEAAENNAKKVGSYAGYQDFIAGANYQAKRMYSEEEVKKLLIRCKDRFSGSELHDYTSDETVIEYFFAPKT
jgi:hypothetical protein